jgi:CRISPR/Cas system type I-B associated protein Csh2 (Cas7 group RAMP superfamily)
MDTNTETRTVQNYRHEARRVLTQARERLALRTESTQVIYGLLNGSIEHTLAGRQGLTQEQQVSALDEAISTVESNLEEVTAAVEQAKAEIVAQIEAWDFEGALVETLSVLHAARDLAASRDFEAHQTAKYGSRYSEPDDSFEEDEYDDED